MDLWFADPGPGHGGQTIRYNQIANASSCHWAGSDTEAQWKRNWHDPAKQRRLIDLGYEDPACITYQLNTQGFRCQEFDDRPAGLAIGCSHTMGIGNRVQETWPAILGEMLNVHIWNLGVGGSGLDTQFRLLDFYAKLLRPKFVVHGVPSKTRSEIFARDRWYHVMIENYYFDKWAPYWQEYFLNDVNSDTNTKRNFMAIRWVCQQLDIPYYALWVDFQLDPEKDIGTARDLMHYGPKRQTFYARSMCDLMRENPKGAVDDYTRISCSQAAIT